MLRYVPGCGYESNRIDLGFIELVTANAYGETFGNILKAMDSHKDFVKLHPKSYHDVLPNFIIGNLGTKNLVKKACNEYIYTIGDQIAINIRARWAASVDSYKLLYQKVPYTRFCQQFDDFDNNLSLVLYVQSFDEKFDRCVFFCLDFVEMPRAQLLRKIDI